MSDRAYIDVNRVQRPYLVGIDERPSVWRTRFISPEGMVNIYAEKPWIADGNKDIPGRMVYEVISGGLDFYFTEPRYRTGRGASIIAGKLLRCANAIAQEGGTIEKLKERLRAKWSGMYGQPLEN